MTKLYVPALIAVSGAFMSAAWLGHLRFKAYGFWVALVLSWLVVLPEYVLNVVATRAGHGTFTGAQMAAMHLCSGVVCTALVSRFVLGEPFTATRAGGLALLAAGMFLTVR